MSKFNWRGFVSVLLSFAFLAVAVTGLVLWLSDSRTPLGISKGVWKHTHIDVSLLLIAAGVLHLVLNGQKYCGYWRRRSADGRSQLKELVLALAVTALLVAGGAVGNHGPPPGRGGSHGPGGPPQHGVGEK
jgi:hypothetical protein